MVCQIWLPLFGYFPIVIALASLTSIQCTVPGFKLTTTQLWVLCLNHLTKAPSLCIFVSLYLCIFVSLYLCIFVSLYLCIFVSLYLCIFNLTILTKNTITHIFVWKWWVFIFSTSYCIVLYCIFIWPSTFNMFKFNYGYQLWVKAQVSFGTLVCMQSNVRKEYIIKISDQ